MARSHLTTKAVQQQMLAEKPRSRYAPDLKTPIGTLRDAIETQCARAKHLLDRAMEPIRRVA
jgi:hypothetical protein